MRFRSIVQGAALTALFLVMFAACETNPLYYSYPEPRPIIKPAPIVLPAERAKYGSASKMEGFSPVVQWSKTPVFESKGDVYRYIDEVVFLAVIGNRFYFSVECPERKDLAWIAVYFGEEEALKNYFVCDLTQKLVDQGTEIVFPTTDFRVGAGDPHWEAVKYFQLAFQARDGKVVRLKPYLLASFRGTGN